MLVPNSEYSLYLDPDYQSPERNRVRASCPLGSQMPPSLARHSPKVFATCQA